MENLTAFVRERSRRNEAERTSLDFGQRVSRCAYLLWSDAGQPEGRDEEFWANAVTQDALGEPPATDVAAVLAVINRRRGQEGANAWLLDLSVRPRTFRVVRVGWHRGLEPIDSAVIR